MNEQKHFFVQISDLQLGMYRPVGDAFVETDLVAQAVARINALAPAFVVCTGDLIELPGSARQMAQARSLLDGLDPDIPFIAIPGNHDIGDVPTPDDLDWFRRQVGRDWFSFNHRGWHFIGLNSCLLAAGELVSAEAERQWRWLQEDLDRSDARDCAGKIVFMHHPLFLNKARETDDYFNLPRPSRDRCVEIFRAHGIQTVLAGHLHRCNEASCGELHVVATGPVGMPLHDGYSGLRIVCFGAEGVRHHFYALDDVEGQELFVSR